MTADVDAFSSTTLSQHMLFIYSFCDAFLPSLPPSLPPLPQTPSFFLEKCDNPDFTIIRFHAGPPYEDVAFKILNKEVRIGDREGGREGGREGRREWGREGGFKRRPALR